MQAISNPISMVQNPAALDAHGNLVSASKAEKQKDYFCVSCHGRMRLAGGDNTQMQLHFRHIEPGAGHPFAEETFLHDYAKHYIAKQIETSEEFDIGYWTSEICCNDNCPLNNHDCRQNILKSYNLKQYYDTVQVEVWRNGFKPDILVTSKRFAESPIFIEIAVTHECEPEKIQSGIRIIEIKIPQDFNHEKLSLAELIENREGYQYNSGIEVKFYNFEKKHQIKAEKPFGERMHKRFKAIVQKEDGGTPIWPLDCYDYGKKMRKDHIVEVHFAIEEDKFKYTPAKAIAALNGMPCKDCRLCTSIEEYSVWPSKYRCTHTKQDMTKGRAAENCPNYSFSRYEAIKWASKLDAQYHYVILDKTGKRITPFNVEKELQNLKSYGLDDDMLPY